MKDILIITNYYPPETGAASNRIFQLAHGLEKLNFKVSVICPLPNYPTGKVFEAYKGRIKHTSKENNIITVKPESDKLGFVGTPTHIKTNVLKEIIKVNEVPVVAPLGLDENNQTFTAFAVHKLRV